MRIIQGLLLLGFLYIIPELYAQDLQSLIGGMDQPVTPENVQIMRGPFSGLNPSVETPDKSELLFVLGHRFDRISGGFYEMFGLDAATMRLGFEYGIMPVISAGFGRSTFEKSWDFYVKTRLIRQQVGATPFSSTLYAAGSVNTLKNFFPAGQDGLNDRMTVSVQWVNAVRFGRLSIHLIPGYLYQRFDPIYLTSHQMWSVGTSLNFAITKRTGFMVDYKILLNDLPYDKANPLTLGVNLDTGGHLFQLLFGNSTGMTPKAIDVQTNGRWRDGDIYFGFNLIRTFTLSEN